MPRREESLNSSALQSAAYDDELNTLEVTFKNGNTYSFFAVPPDVFEELVTSNSPGGYYNRVIKPRYG